MTDESENLRIDNESASKEQVADDPYAYLERDFSSENFKIEVKNLPKYYGISVCTRLLLFISQLYLIFLPRNLGNC